MTRTVDPTAYVDRAPGEEIRREYTVLSRAWYGDASLRYLQSQGIVDEINVGHFSSGGGTTGEFKIELHKFMQASNSYAVRVCIFDDAWHLLVHEAELFQRIGSLPRDSSLADVERVLQEIGFRDATPTKER